MSIPKDTAPIGQQSREEDPAEEDHYREMAEMRAALAASPPSKPAGVLTAQATTSESSAINEARRQRYRATEDRIKEQAARDRAKLN